MGATPMRLVMRALLAAVILPAAMGGQGLVSAGAYVDPAHDGATRVRVEPVLRLAGAAYQAPSDTATPGTDAAAGTATPAAPPASANTTTTATPPASAAPDVSVTTPATPPAGSTDAG